MCAVDVAADQRVDRADVQAGGAADALEDLLELLVLGRPEPAVVEEDDVHLLHLFDPLPVLLHHGRRGAGDHRHVARHELGGGAPGEDLEDRRRVFDRGDQLFVAHDRHLDPGKGGHHPGVSLVRHQADRAVFGDQEVGAGDPHVRLEKLLPELLPRRLDHEGDVGRDLFLELLREVLGHLEAAQMDGGHHHVGGLLAGQGDDPLAQVRLGGGDPGGLEVGVQVDLLGGHRFGLDDPLDPLFLAEIHQVGLQRVAVLRPEHLHPALRRLRLEPVGHRLDLGDGRDLHLFDRLAEGLDVAGVGVRLGPGLGVHLGEAPQGAAERLVLQLFGDLFPEVSRISASIRRHLPSAPRRRR